MRQSEIANTIRRLYKKEKRALDETIKKQKGDKRKYRDEYYFNSELAHEFGVELYSGDFELY